MATAGDRLRQARTRAGYRTASEAADALDTPRGTYIGHENGSRPIGTAQAKVYGAKFNVRPEWILFDISEVSTGEEPRRIPLSEWDPAAPDPINPDLTPTTGSHTGTRGIPEGTIPQIDVTAGMGAGGVTVVSDGVPGVCGMTFSAESVSDYWRLPTAFVAGLGAKITDLAFLPVQGDSMLPTLEDGEVIAADTRHRWPSPDGIYALADEFGGVIVKRLQVVSPPGQEPIMVDVISDNPHHKTKTWPAADLRILGRVVIRVGRV